MIGLYLWVLSILTASCAAYALTFRTSPRWPKWLYRGAWTVSMILGAWWLLVIFHTLFVCGPLELWIIRLRSYRALDWTQPLIGVFAALLQLKTNAKRSPKGAFSRHNGLALVLLLILPPHLDSLVYPCWPRWAREWKDGVCIQSEGYTCAAAATATILKLHGREASEEEVSRQILMTTQGASTWDVLRCLRGQGLHPSLALVAAQPQDLPVPCLAMVRLGDHKGIPHMLTILAKTDKTFMIGDPLGGRFEWSKEMTWKNYYFSGVVVHIPN